MYLYDHASMVALPVPSDAVPGLASLAEAGRVRAAVVGATGYAGGELLRILSRHPAVSISGAVARGRSGESIAASQPHLAGLGSALRDTLPETDLVFLALPHGVAAAMAADLVAGGRSVIDLGPDFRLSDPAAYPAWYGWQHPEPGLLRAATYGLPELHREELQRAGEEAGALIAAPGCYPTAAILALAPLARAGLIGDLVIDAKSGVSGAGREPKPELGFSEVNESVRAYGLAGHRHVPEIAQELAALVPSTGGGVEPGPAADPADPFDGLEFVPHLVPMTRGILATCYVRPTRSISEAALLDLYASAYATEPFVRLVEDAPATKHVLGSNEARVFVRLQPRSGRVVAMAVIDNLVKGAAGQAVQAFNAAAGLDERTGLDALAVNP
jgi:N-acetyl-gamma-glutamyl-phosphate reductase